MKRTTTAAGRVVASTSGLSWLAPVRQAAIVVTAILAMLVAVMPTPAGATEAASESVVVRFAAGTPGGADLIEAAGGSVTAELDIINGFAAEMTSEAIATLNGHPAVQAITLDAPVELTEWDRTLANSESVSTLSSKFIDADAFWNAGYRGDGVDVALIDSGVAALPELSGRIVNGPDLSFESQNAALIYQDTYGHGTHLAGIIAGRGTDAPASFTTKDARKNFLGVAPNSRIVSVKVATRNGATDVSQVIAAIDWVVQHRNDNGLNIRVLNLAFGTDGSQGHEVDPLAFAVEQAWKHGIVVVAAAGNDGNGSDLRNPASDPFVIAVGAADAMGTGKTADDRVTSFTSCGTWQRHVDVVAPGKSVLSLIAPGSDASTHTGSISGNYIAGSGTSQAAAFVAGAAALVVDRYPNASPDQVKALLMNSATSLRNTSSLCQGAGRIDMREAYSQPLPKATQRHRAAAGTGSLDAARGTYKIAQNGVVLEGEQDIFGNPWDGASWSSLAAAGMSWSGGTWNGASWSGASWSGMSWSGASWSGMSWSGASWSGMSWSGMSWSGMSWSGNAWLGLSWNGPAGLI